jgi:F-type H+-transporting ATPase subunit a
VPLPLLDRFILLASDAASHGAEEHGGSAVHHGTHVFFEIMGLQVTSEVTTMWAIMAVMVLFAWWGTREINKVPSGPQNVLELVIDTIVDAILEPMMGKEKARKYFPLLGTIFLFILISNYSGLLPGAGMVPGFKPPTGTWGGTLGLALVVFASTHIAGMQERGVFTYLKHFFEPYFFFLPLNILEALVKPLSLSLRLYGNIFGEETLLAVIILQITAIVAPVPIMGLSMIFGAVQAYIFTMLASVYIAEATEGGH